MRSPRKSIRSRRITIEAVELVRGVSDGRRTRSLVFVQGHDNTVLAMTAQIDARKYLLHYSAIGDYGFGAPDACRLASPTWVTDGASSLVFVTIATHYDSVFGLGFPALSDVSKAHVLSSRWILKRAYHI